MQPQGVRQPSQLSARGEFLVAVSLASRACDFSTRTISQDNEAEQAKKINWPDLNPRRINIFESTV